jgi:hypothetical protein
VSDRSSSFTDRCFFFRELLNCPDPIPTIPLHHQLDNKENGGLLHSSTPQQNNRFDKYQPPIIENKKRENLSRNLFETSKKLREELGVSNGIFE